MWTNSSSCSVTNSKSRCRGPGWAARMRTCSKGSLKMSFNAFTLIMSRAGKKSSTASSWVYLTTKRLLPSKSPWKIMSKQKNSQGIISMMQQIMASKMQGNLSDFVNSRLYCRSKSIVLHTISKLIRWWRLTLSSNSQKLWTLTRYYHRRLIWASLKWYCHRDLQGEITQRARTLTIFIQSWYTEVL